MADKIFSLDYLLERQKGPAAGGAMIELMGVAYRCRNADVLEDFFVFVAAVDELVKKPFPEGEGTTATAEMVEVSERYRTLRTQCHRLIRALVPDLPADILEEHFATVRSSRKLLEAVIDVIAGAASEELKKNAGGTGPEQQIRLGETARREWSGGSMSG